MPLRQLSAIMFTDLVGYTAMMQEDETHAKSVRDLHRGILEEKVEDHNGKILQYYGDGALSVFNSAVSASDAAISIQRNSIKKEIPLRIGIHTGDVVIEDDGVYGDGVNIASRIESFATPGSVMISDKVYDDLKNHHHIQSRLMGEFELKNVKRPVEVYVLTNEGLSIPTRTDLKGKVKERVKSIAVLPFTNRSMNPEHEHLCDGLTEELIHAFTKLQGLNIISRTTAFSLKGKMEDIRKTGESLEVESVMDGSFRISGANVRVMVQLSSTKDGYQLWTETYDAVLDDPFALQDEITSKVIGKFETDLVQASGEGENTSKTTENKEAYDAYQEGLFHYNKWVPAGFRKAKVAFERAIALDANYDKAHAGLAMAYSLLSFSGFMETHEGFRKSLDAANRALALNTENESAYIALSYYETFYVWDFNKAKVYMDKALELSPKFTDALIIMGFHHLREGDFDLGMSYVLKAREVDPISPVINRTLADFYYFKGDYKMSIEVHNWILEQYPDFHPSVDFKAWCYVMMGEYDQAITLFESLEDTFMGIKPYVQLGYVYALKGDREIALDYLYKLKLDKQANELNFATLYTGLGMFDEAMEYLIKCKEKRLGACIAFNISPIWKPLRNDPRFDLLLQQIGLRKVHD